MCCDARIRLNICLEFSITTRRRAVGQSLIQEFGSDVIC